MSAPALQVYIDGTTNRPVSGDNLNTFQQTCDTYADLRAFIGTAGVQVFTRGGAAVNDGSQGSFYWSSTSTAADNNSSVIRPNGLTVGAWLRLTSTTSDLTALFASPPPLGNVTPNLVYSSGGALNGTIGATTPTTGAFTTVAASTSVIGGRGSFALALANQSNAALATTGNVVNAAGSFGSNFKATIGQVTGTMPAAVNLLHYFQTQTDTSKTTGEVINLGVYSTFGGGAFSGARANVRIATTYTGTSSAQAVPNAFHRGLAVTTYANGNDGGDSVTSQGNWFGIINDAQLQANATYWLSLTGMETDVSIRTGGSAKFLIGQQIVQKSDHAVAADTQNVALSFTNQAAGVQPGWDTVITFGAANGVWAPATTLIGTTSTVAGLFSLPYTATNGVKWDTVTFSGNAWASDAFSVTGSGQQTIGSNTITWGTAGLTIGTAGSVSTAVAVASGGGGYQLNGHLRAAGGVFLITGVTAGVVTSVSTITAANVTGSTPANPVATTSNTGGSGATLNLTWTTAPLFTATGHVVSADYNSVYANGAVGNGIATDLTALTGTTMPAYLPKGTFYTAAAFGFLSPGVANRRWYSGGGGGSITTSDGPQSGNISVVRSAPSYTGPFGVFTSNFNGAMQNHLGFQTYVTGASTLGTPATGYQFNPALTGIFGSIYSTSGYNNGPATDDGRTNLAAVHMQLNQGGNGDLVAYQATGIITGVRAGATYFLGSPVISVISGNILAGVDYPYIDLDELSAGDNGFLAASSGIVRNFYRNATVAAGKVSQDWPWMGIRVQSQGATAIDAFFSPVGKGAIGIDFTCVDTNFVNTSGATTNAAIVAKANHRFYMNGVNTLSGGSGQVRIPSYTAVGTEWYEYDATLGHRFVVGSATVANANATALSAPSIIGSASLFGPLLATEINNAAGVTYTAAQMLGGVIVREGLGAGVSDTTATAADIVAAIPGCVVGTGFRFSVGRYTNTFQITVLAGTGVTLNGTVTVTANRTRDWIGTVTNVGSGTEAVTMTSYGSGQL